MPLLLRVGLSSAQRGRADESQPGRHRPLGAGMHGLYGPRFGPHEQGRRDRLARALPAALGADLHGGCVMACEHPMHDDDCPFGCEAPRVCEFCGMPATDERTDDDREHERRVMLVCDDCAEEHDRAERRRREEDARGYAADQKISEWKDEGRWR